MARAHIAQREYRATPVGTSLQAPNRRHNLRTYFEPSGIRVHDRTATGSPQLVGLSLVGVGRGDTLTTVDPGTLEVSSQGARVEIRRPGLIEWYANSAEGLEQGFTLAKRPGGPGDLALDLAIDHAKATLAGDRVLLATSTGRQLAYDKLIVLDGAGKAVEARFEVPDAEHVRLVVADAGAAYPLTIDPLLSETADTQLEANQLGGQLGSSVAGAGDVNGDGFTDVIVGAALYDAGQADEGAAFVFLGSASGIANGNPTTAIAQIESNQVGARMGLDVAGAGDVNGDGYSDVLVGAHLYDAPEVDEGAAWIFLGSPTGVHSGNPATAATQLEGNQISSGMGGTLSGAGDVNRDGYSDVIIGAYAYDAGETDEGAAFVFLGSATGIASGNPLTAATRLESNQIGAGLGQGVASAGDVNGDGYGDLIVSAYLYDAGQTDEGAAWVFQGGPTGVANGNPATASAQLESNQTSASMGISADGAGDVNGDGYADVIVGAYLYDSGETDEGAAFVFLGSASGITNGNPATAATRLESNQIGGNFGENLAGAGDVNGDGYADVIVGAWTYDGNGEFPTIDAGAAFVFLGGTTGIPNGNPATAFANIQTAQANALLGFAVGAAGDVNGDGYADVIVGAYQYDAGQLDEGAAFVYRGGSLGIVDGDPTTAATRLESDQVDSSFGKSVFGVGDVNGDGYDDVIVNAPFYDAGQFQEGAAFVFLGSPSGIVGTGPLTASAQIESNQVGALLSGGAGAGDVNGDGYADVIVGLPSYTVTDSREGIMLVFHGGPSGIADGNPSTATTRVDGIQTNGHFGFGRGAGDVNGDGYGDVVIGGGFTETAYVFLGSPSGIPSGTAANAATLLVSDQAARFGTSVAGAGDVNGDGYSDVIVGASAYDASLVDVGAAFIFHGSAAGIPDGTPANAATRIQGSQSATDVPVPSVALGLGFSVDGAGDVNGDGYADVIVGTPYHSAGQVFEGAAFVFHGSPTGVANGSPGTAASQLESDLAGAQFGVSVAGTGDVNGDGYADVAVLADTYGVKSIGFVFLGSDAGIADGNPATAAAWLETNQNGSGLVSPRVSGAGDVNGDGYADVIVGSPTASLGAAYVFLGNGDGRTVLARQLRGDGSNSPVQPWGKSYADDNFKVRMLATHPAGRGRVKLEVERCPTAVPFGHITCAKQRSASWIDVTATSTGVELTETISGLTTNKLYRWRARVLYAPFAVTQPGITPPSNPAHGPWRRVSAQAIEADVRLLPEPDATNALVAGVGLLGWMKARRRRRMDASTRPVLTQWRSPMTRIAALVLLVLAFAPPAFASDGVLEINQACVTAGCFAGDVAGFPVTLPASGSYRLTGNLVVPAGATAILIAASNVSLDLGGFEVKGPNTCAGYPVTSCTGTSTSNGIVAPTANEFRARVHNGNVTGFDRACIDLAGNSSVVEHVGVFFCGGDGIRVGFSGRVSQSFSASNFLTGISLTGGGGAAEGNEVRGNHSHGILIDSIITGSVATGNRTIQNGALGISATSYVLVTRNVVTANATFGISSGKSLADNLCDSVIC